MEEEGCKIILTCTSKIRNDKSDTYQWILTDTIFMAFSMKILKLLDLKMKFLEISVHYSSAYIQAYDKIFWTNLFLIMKYYGRSS